MPDEIEEVKETGAEGNDEIITPDNVHEKLDIEKPEEEKETPAESSEAKKPDGETIEESEESDESKEEAVEESELEKPDVSDTTDTDNVDGKEPKSVPGETPRERALRLETGRVKKLLRQERTKKLLGDVQPEATVSTELSPEEKKVLEGFDPEQVANQEKLFNVLAKKHGYVRKDEFSKQTYIDTAQEVLDDFLEQHEEYSVEKDPDGILWKQFQEEFGLYQKPANPRGFKRILNKVHNDIFGITTTPKQIPSKVAAQQEKLKVASTGSAATKPTRLSDKQKPAGSASTELSKIARSGGLKGFSEEELAELGL